MGVFLLQRRRKCENVNFSSFRSEQREPERVHQRGLDMPKGVKNTNAKAAKEETREEYRQRIMDIVCGCLAEGKSLRQVCRAVEGMPTAGAICHWLAEDEKLAKQYARAREFLTDIRFDEFRDAATEIVTQYLKEGWEPKDAIAMARLQTGNMQWEISKLNPKKYGDKITHSGDEENPINVINKIERVVIKPQ